MNLTGIDHARYTSDDLETSLPQRSPAMDGLADEQIALLLRWIKEGPAGTIPVTKQGQSIGRLQGVTWEDASDRCAIQRLGEWHVGAFAWFSQPLAVTPQGVRRWLVDQVLANTHRVLFWVRDLKGEPRGHVGLTSIDLDAGTATIGDVITCHPDAEPLLSAAIETLAEWTRTDLGLSPVWAAQAHAMAA